MRENGDIIIENDGFNYDTSSEDENEQDQGKDFEEYDIARSDPEEDKDENKSINRRIYVLIGNIGR